MKIQPKYIFVCVLAFGLVYHFFNFSNYWYDQGVWEKQIQYFVSNDQHQFDYFGAYGHPGMTIVGLGAFFHNVFGASYHTALRLSMSILMAVPAAASTVIAILLYPRSLWWVTTAYILIFTRLYTNATPPTATVMPFIALIVLAGWWLWELRPVRRRWPYLLWGAAVGLSAATRLDVSLLVGTAMSLLLWKRGGFNAVLPTLGGALLGFVVGDPYMWFMPVRHVVDLAGKFIVHHGGPEIWSMNIHFYELYHIPLAVLSILWTLFIEIYKRPLRIIPPQIVAAFLGTTVLAAVVVLSSKFQAIRYFYPFIVVWEILLPLLALETISPSGTSGSLGSVHYNDKSLLFVIVFVLIYTAAH